MGRKWRWIAAVLVLVLGIATVAYADEWYNGYRVVALYLDGQTVKSDVPPIIMDGRTLLPVRALTEAMGHDVQWNGETWTVSLATQPRLDMVKSPTGLYMSLQAVAEVSASDTGNDALAGRVATTVRIVNRGDGPQEVDLSRLHFIGTDDSGNRTHIAPHVLETWGKQPAAGSTIVVLARGEEVNAVLGYDLAPSEQKITTEYRLAMVNAAGEPQVPMRAKIKVRIECNPRPCKIIIIITL